MNSGNNRQIDQKGKAIYNCKKFLALWKDADPGIAEVDDACTSARQSQDGKAAKLILELVLMIVAPKSWIDPLEINGHIA